GKEVEFGMLFVGFVFFVIDIGTDIRLAVEYNRQCETLWFRLTLLFILAPYVVISIMAAFQKKEQTGCQRLIASLQCLLSSLIWRYVEEYQHWKRRHCDNSPCQENYEECSCANCENYRKAIKESNESAYNFAWLRYVETIAESAPQWCLQVSIMLVRWNFPRLTVTSAVFSFFSLALSITTLEKARVTKDGHKFKLLPHTVVFFTSQVFTLLSRLSAIVIFAYALNELVAIFLAIHL
ncbi:XK-related 6, partial [Paramuricea clavata]